MFINHLSSASLFLRPIVNAINKQDRLKIAISALACAILLGGAIYWTCSRSWSQRRVQPKADPKLPSPAPQKKADDAANHAPKEDPEPSSPQKSQDLKDVPKQEPQKEKAEPSKIEQPEPVVDAITPQAEIKSDICITSSLETGCVGNDPSHIPNIHQFELEDRKPLPLKGNDILLTLHVFNHKELPSNIYLPTALFADKKEGDTLRLYFNGKLIELKINQAHHNLKFERGDFKEVLEQTIMAGQDKIEDQIGLFDRYDPFFYWNKFGDQTTSVYNLGKVANCQFQLQKIPTDQLRPLQKTAIIHDPRLDEEDLEEKDRLHYLKNQKSATIIETLPMDILNGKEGFYFLADLAGFDANLFEDYNSIQIALNDRWLGIHILRYEQKRSTVMENQETMERLEIEYPIKPKEFVRGYVWKKLFQEMNFEQVKASLESASLILKDGVFQIFIPKAAPETPLAANQEQAPKEEEQII